MFLKKLFGILLIPFVVSLVAAKEIKVPEERLPFETPEAKKIIARIENGDVNGAVKEATKVSKRKPENIEVLMILGSLQAERGDYADAITSLEKGIRGRESDLPFLLALGKIHEDRARLGPSGARVGGMVRYTASAAKGVDEAAFRTEQFRRAAEYFNRVLLLRPDVKPYQAKHSSLLLLAGDARGAGLAAREYLKINPDEPELWLQLAKAALKNESRVEAREAATRCVALRITEPEAYRVLAQLAARDGLSDEAEQLERKARYFAYVPEFLSVPYTPEAYAGIAPLILEEGEMDETKSKLWIENAVAAIDAKIVNADDVTSRLLGIIAWRHEWHGKVEDRIYAELERRKAEFVLMAIFERANSACTVGSAVPALARLKSEAAFPLIIERLSSDRNMFPMYLPEALALYGKPEAVAPLGRAFQDALRDSVRAGRSLDAMMGGMGTGMLVERCLWAIASFKTPEARRLLEVAAKQPACRMEATAALFRQSGEAGHLQVLLKLLKKSPDQAEWIARRFRDAELPEAAALEEIARTHAAKKGANRRGD